MLLDTRIPLAAVQPRRSLTEDFAQALQIKAAQQQMAAQEAALAEKTQRKNALKGAIGPNGIDYEAAERIMLGLGDVEGAIGLRGQKLKEGEAQTKAASAEIELRAKQIEDEGRLLSGVRDAQSLEAARQQAAARGYDVSDWPTEYNPQLIDQAVRATMDPKVRYEIAAKEADNKAKQADRDRRFGLDERRTAAAERRAQNEPLVEVYDPKSETGTVFVPRSQAAGRAGKPPSGMEITLPDGTVVRQGRGAGSAAPGNDPLEKSVRTETQKDVISATSTLARLDEIANSYKSDYLTYGGRIRAGVGRVADKMGVASEGQKDFVAGRRKFTQQVNQEFNAYRKDITGAAAAMAELESLKKAMLSEDLGPAEFESAYNTYRDSVSRLMRIKQAILRDGVPLGSREFNKRLDDAWVGGADDSADARGAELEASGMPEAQVVQQLKREGYTR